MARVLKLKGLQKTKQAAVLDYLAGKGSLREIAQKYNLRSQTQLREWLKVYNTHGDFEVKEKLTMSGTRNTIQEERLKIVQDCLSQDKNYRQIATKYQVSYTQVYNWVKKYEKMGSAGLEDRRGQQKGSLPGRTPDEELRQELSREKQKSKELEMQVELLKKVKEHERRDRLD